jgi:hypothetical protein
MDGSGCKAKSVKSFNHVAERHRCPREIWGRYWLDRKRFGRKVFRRFGNSPVLYWNGVVKYSDNSHNSSPIVMLNSLGEN